VPEREVRGRRPVVVVALIPVLVVALTGCGVETVEGEIADQQQCVAAQPLVEAVGARGRDTGGPSGALPDTGALADRAADAELRSALTDLGDTYADASGDPPDSAAWGEADRAVTTLSRVCQRLAAF
jgi:hypothetical protein